MKVQLLHSSIGAAKFINAQSEPYLWLRETMPIGTAKRTYRGECNHRRRLVLFLSSGLFNGILYYKINNNF